MYSKFAPFSRIPSSFLPILAHFLSRGWQGAQRINVGLRGVKGPSEIEAVDEELTRKCEVNCYHFIR